ncbi:MULTISPECIES: outer membrane protein assembly factor BamE [unclassified Meridianimarinicoccus]|uniref:outer membrane protein assembly factor BamE n=1 Tax=unclassified Meridianimarinicoccus TaxID=2923344 RepID=UPI001D00BA8F|nr:outer membrane protein assembly factor BamE [Fluviibacterium sp. MJW13]
MTTSQARRKMMNRLFPQIRRTGRLAAVAGVLLAAACQPIVRNHGYVPPEDQLSEVSVGRDTRDSVAEKIGLPLNKGIDGDRAWYYVASTRETFGARAPKVVEREVVAILFNDNGTVRNIVRLDEQDGQVVTLTARVTNPSVADRGLLRQIFGNVGTPTAGDFLE